MRTECYTSQQFSHLRPDSDAYGISTVDEAIEMAIKFNLGHLKSAFERIEPAEDLIFIADETHFIFSLKDG